MTSASGSVTDAEQTPTASWSVFSKNPSTAPNPTFGNASQPVTTASFREVGTYVLRLTGADGYTTSTDDVTISVVNGVSNALTVTNGSGDGTYAAGIAVPITADPPASGYRFVNWTSSGGGSFANSNSSTTTYTMPANAATVKALLDRGAKIDAREEVLGEQALMWAAAENHADVVTLLIARGADPNMRSDALKFAKDRFGLEGVLTILPKGNWTPLMYAARDGAPDGARALARGGADVNATDPEGTTALVRAIINGHYDTAAVLLEEGANPNIADTSNMGALYAAVDMSSLGEIYGRPPRQATDRHSVLDLIELLLAKGADVNAKLKTATLTRNHTPGEGTLGDGATPLMRAAKHGDYRAVEILLKHGADVSMKQRQGSTALLFACGFGRGQSAFAEDVGTEADLFKAVQLLVEHGADVKVNNDQGGTVMHFAAQAGFNSVVKYLAAKGAPLDQKDKQGRTPVDVANGVGGRGRAGGPPVIHKDTAALIQQLVDAGK